MKEPSVVPRLVDFKLNPKCRPRLCGGPGGMLVYVSGERFNPSCCMQAGGMHACILEKKRWNSFVEDDDTGVESS